MTGTTDLSGLRALLVDLTSGCEPGPWHAVSNSIDGFWLENAAGDASVPEPADVALIVNALPGLFDRLAALERVADLCYDAAIDAHAFAYLSVVGDEHAKEWAYCESLTCAGRRAALAALDEESDHA